MSREVQALRASKEQRLKALPQLEGELAARPSRAAGEAGILEMLADLSIRGGTGAERLKGRK